MILKQILAFQVAWLFKNLFPNQFSCFNNIFLLILVSYYTLIKEKLENIKTNEMYKLN